MKHRYKVFYVQNQHFLYYDPCMSILSLDKSVAESIENETFFAHNNPKYKEFAQIYHTPLAKENQNNTHNLRQINRITLCVSNDCNLRCKYCFAQGGSYGETRTQMSIDMAKEFVCFCDKYFDSIKTILFFGGEPLLNIEVIEFVCKNITKIYKEKKKVIPKFCIITNGTILNASVMKLMEKYINRVTISVDGPKLLHDFNRVYINGKGSYDIVANFIQEMKRIKNLQVSYEATFTKEAIEKGYTYASLRGFFINTLGIKGTIINDSHLDKTIAIDYIKSITKEQMIESNFGCMSGDFWKILDLLVKRENNLLCNIGFKNISISVKGEVFVCHLVNGKKKCSLGHINKRNIFNHPEHYRDIICDLNKKYPVCESCWCMNLCGGCTIECLYDERTGTLLDSPNLSFCHFLQQYAAQALMLMITIRQDKSLWDLLTKKLNNS